MPVSVSHPPSADAVPPLLADGLPLLSPDEGEAQHGDETDKSVPAHGFSTLPVVGLGGSAGSIAALGEFFKSTPAQSGLAYVVVLHLAPDHESLLPELLQRQSAMPVHVAEDVVKLEPDNVYVIPPGKYLTMTDGHLRITELRPEYGKRVAVDLFFRSLADTHGPHAVAIVLSGADGDGAIGLKRIKERGGLTIAQDPGECEYPSMPQSAIATGMVDWVLKAAEMPARIAAYRTRERRLQLPCEEGPQPVLPTPVAAGREQQLRDILHFLHGRTGRDFSCYKRATIVRRIARRMQVTSVDDMPAYLGVLRTQPGEATALVGELLISVTNFFRDREAFEALEPHIAALCEGKRSAHALRVWVAACATGEEAYSMAMLLLEQARKCDSPPSLQVFASDLDDDAIRAARAGFYPETITADVSEDRLQRFFTKVPHGYLMRREVREMVLFATHDLLKDAPFSRIDLLSCRNLLIYLDREAQTRCFEIFNFALKPHGVLFLGSAETAPEDGALFAPLHKKHRIYRQQPSARIGVPMSGGHGENAIQRVLQRRERETNAQALPSGAFSVRPLLQGAQPAAPAPALPASELHLRLLGRLGPPSAFINADHDILHLSESASPFLQFPEGEPTTNLLRLARPALRAALRSALLAAEESGQAVEALARTVDLPSGPVVIDLRVAPAGDLAPGHFIVLFGAHEPRALDGTQALPAAADAQATAAMQQLEQQLARSGVRLQATVERYEVSTEELKAGNQELQAMNEELRSAGEELESGREELQSVNEELTTLNVEFKSQVEELSRANSDLHNLMSATQIATVFLDRQLRIMRYTPSAAPLFNLITADVGRPISDLQHRLDYPQLAADAQAVLASLIPVEREMRAESGWVLARVLPYRTVEDQIAGVVLTFIDITDRKSFEGALRASEQRLQTLADAVPQIIWTNDRDGKAIYFNRRWYEYSGCSTEESVGPGWQAIVHPDDTARSVARWQHVLLKGEVFDCEYRLRGVDGSYRWFIGRNVPTRDALGEVDGWFGTATDIADMKAAEASLRASEEQFRRAIEDAPIPVIMQAEDGQVLQISKAWTALTGYPPDEVPTFEAWLSQIEGPGADTVRCRMQELFNGNVSVLNADVDVTTRDGSARHWVFSASAPGALRDGRRFVVGMVLDITESRRAEAQLRESQERLRLIVDNARDYAIFSMNLDRRITSWNTGAQAILGFTQEEAIGLSGDVIFTPEDRASGAPEGEAGGALANGRAADERWHLRKDGSRFWGSGVMMSMMSMTEGPGTPVGLVKIFRDQTAELLAKEAMEQAQRQLYAALQETEIARDQAEAAGKVKDRFLATLSHELRAPLAPVLLGAQILARNKAMPADALHAVAVIERNVRLQAHLIDDLLDVSRIMHSKMELALETVDLHASIARAIEVSHPDLDAKAQTLTVALEAAQHTVHGDAKRLAQVFWNLLKNASKFTPKDGGVTVRSWNSGRRLIVEVCDTGVGFEPEAATRIFSAFEQGSRLVTVQYGGLGLGLAIAEASVKAHGGSISANSNGPGTGATFTVDLPLQTQPMETGVPVTATSPG